MGEGVEKLTREFDAGHLDRDLYWNRMRENHVGLRGYQALVRRAGIDAIEISADDLFLRLENGLRFVWRPEDIRTQPSVLVNNGEYEREELDLFEALTDVCTTVFDIGANVGWYAVHLGVRLRDRGELWAFEPVPDTYAMLQRNVEVNDLNQTVKMFPFGLSERSGKMCFYVPASSGSVAASERPLFPDDDNEQVEVELRTLDDLASEYAVESLDLIKCDVEGAEILVLKGGMATIERLRPVIMLEMLRKWSAVYGYHPNDIIELLSGIGYSCWTVRGSNLERVARVTAETVETNFFFDETCHEEILRHLSAAVGRERA